MSRYIDLNTALSFPYANGKYDKKNANTDFIKGCESYKEWLESLPAADVQEVRRGQWIPLEKEIGLYECSICGHKILRAECNYCPNCGAKMEGEQNG